jgi:hypothetical protein
MWSHEKVITHLLKQYICNTFNSWSTFWSAYRDFKQLITAKELGLKLFKCFCMPNHGKYSFLLLKCACIFSVFSIQNLIGILFNGQEDPDNPVYLSEKKFITFFLFSNVVGVNLSKKKQF